MTIRNRQTTLTRTAEAIARATGSSAIVVGAAGLIGWALQIPVLRSVYPGLTPTTANTSFALMLCGVALRLLMRPQIGLVRPWRPKLVGMICVAVVLAISSATLSEYAASKDNGIDVLLFPRSLGDTSPVRMAPGTAANLLIVALALFLTFIGFGISVAQMMALVASSVGVLAITGYTFAVPGLYTIGQSTPMSVQAAVMTAALGLGVLSARPNRGLMAIFTSGSVGGIVARRLLPVTIGFPFLLISLAYVAQKLRLGRAAFGGEVFLILAIVMFTAPILWTAALLYRTDQKREAAEQHVAKQYELIQTLNRDLESRARQLEVANKELEAFSYSVSHDLRAPLRHISGFIQLLRKHSTPVLDAQSLRYVSVIDDACLKMDQLVDDLLSFSRMGQADMLRQRIDLKDVVRSVIQEATRSTSDRCIQWKVGALPAIEGDPAMIRIVLLNYVSNAVKYTQKRDEPRIEIGAIELGSDAVTIYVRDNGAGFDMQYASKLFGVFQRLHREDEFEGTGIGLATARRIISRHGGRTWAEGVLDNGATFYFSLPVNDLMGVVNEPVEIRFVG